MKNRLILLAALLISASLSGQVKLGIRGGINSSQIKLSDFSGSRYDIDYSKGEIGYHFGLMSQIKILGVFIQPEVLFTTAKNDIKITDVFNSEESFGKQRFYKLDVPVIAGFKIGPLKLQAGPVATKMLGSRYVFDDDNYDIDQTFSNWTIGYQAGLGLELSDVLIDFKYEGNLNRLGDGVEIAGNRFDFDQRMSQWIFSIGYLF